MAAQEDLFDVFSAASEALDGVDDLGEGLDFDMNQDDIQDDLTADTTHQGCAGDSNSPVAKTYVGEDGKVFVNPAALGPAPKRKPLPRYGWVHRCCTYPLLLLLSPIHDIIIFKPFSLNGFTH